MNAEEQRGAVRRDYSAYAIKGGDGAGNLSKHAASWGYDTPFLESLGVHLAGGVADLFATACGGGCPLRLPGAPRWGEAVVDLGCGAGHDAVLASRLVGPRGRVLGVDLTPAMLERAQANVARFNGAGGAGGPPCAPISFALGAFDDGNALRGVAPARAFDVCVSNGVFNLCSDKAAAFAAAFRMLRPGGRLVLCDVCTVPPAAAPPVAAWALAGGETATGAAAPQIGDALANWVSGCVSVAEYLALARAAGFAEARVVALTEFYTSPTTRGVDIVAVRPRRASSGAAWFAGGLAVAAAMAVLVCITRR